MKLDRVSLGLPGATDHAIVRTVAQQAETLGFRALWLNDTPNGDSLAGLAAAASVTSRLGLATGVIPLDRRSPRSLIEGLQRVPSERLTLGVGSGAQRRGSLTRVREGVAELRRLTSAEIVVGALGPKMRALGATDADGVLLSWLRPREATEAMRELRESAGGRPVRAVLYARAIVDAEARPMLEQESAQYEKYPNYAAYFVRTGARALETTIDGTADVAKQVESYAVDELVLRIITADASAESYLRFIDRIAAA